MEQAEVTASYGKSDTPIAIASAITSAVIATADHTYLSSQMAEAGIAEKVAPLILFILVAYLWIREENATYKVLGIGATGAKYLDDCISFGVAPACGGTLRFMLYWRRKSAFETKKKQLKKEEKKKGIDWRMKTRVFVGNVGLGAFASPSESKDKDDDEGGPSKSSKKASSLAQHDATNEFRDLLLLYANRRWVQDKMPPTKDLSLTLIDFGVVEVVGEDGKTHVEQRREPLYVSHLPTLTRSHVASYRTSSRFAFFNRDPTRQVSAARS